MATILVREDFKYSKHDAKRFETVQNSISAVTSRGSSRYPSIVGIESTKRKIPPTTNYNQLIRISQEYLSNLLSLSSTFQNEEI